MKFSWPAELPLRNAQFPLVKVLIVFGADLFGGITFFALWLGNVDISDDLQQKLKEWELNAIVAKIPDECGKIEQIGNSVYYMPEE